jgi:GDPmannose 4,6-dehydratase
MKRALITGITGQDGSYLAELLISKGYQVHGLVRRTSSIERSRLTHLFSDEKIYGKSLFLHYADLNDSTTCRRIIVKVAPNEVYHLAGQSHVGLSFDIPESTCDFTAMGTLAILEILRDLASPPKFFHASSSEIFGVPFTAPQTEETSICPINPYGCAKAFAHHLVRVYRESYGIFAVNGILYNHESPRRGDGFVTRKICRAAAAIKTGSLEKLHLGEVTSLRDWGHAKDYVHGMWLSLQADDPSDYIFASGKVHSVEHFLDLAFRKLGLNWKEYVEVDPHFFRVRESKNLVGDPAKAERVLGWERSYGFDDLIDEMISSEIYLVRSQR